MKTVVVVGRANVGKSTLFNRLSVDVKSITYDVAGVTRDVLRDVVCWQGRCFELIDTGGVSLRKSINTIDEAVRKLALQQIETADVVLFMCDGIVGVLPEDREIAKILHKLGKKAIILINKSDAKVAQEHEHEFERLGHPDTLPISALHGTNIADLLELIVEKLGPENEVADKPISYNVIMLGKPNVGKSSLINLLLKEERAIVDAQAGTTREPISSPMTFYKEHIQVTDTAGIRKKRSIKEGLEGLMVKTSFKALERSDVVLLLIDSSEGHVSDQELKLAFYAFDQQKKALIVLFNKVDLVDEDMQEELERSASEHKFFFDKIPQLSISCKTNKNVGRIMRMVKKVWQRHSQQFSQEELSTLFQEAMTRTPHYWNKRLLIVNKAKQLKTAPITILLFVNDKRFFGPSHLSFFENTMRREFDLKGVPVKFIIRKGK